MMYLRPAEPEEVFHVAKHMRKHDYKEISCLRWAEGRDDLAADLTERYSNYPNCYVCGNGSDCIAIIVYVPIRSGVWSIGMFATDNFQKVGGYLTKKIIREIIPMLMDAGAPAFAGPAPCGPAPPRQTLQNRQIYENKAANAYRRGQRSQPSFHHPAHHTPRACQRIACCRP